MGSRAMGREGSLLRTTSAASCKPLAKPMPAQHISVNIDLLCKDKNTEVQVIMHAPGGALCSAHPPRQCCWKKYVQNVKGGGQLAKRAATGQLIIGQH